MSNTKTQHLDTFTGNITLGEKRSFRNMAVVPLFFNSEQKTKYYTLSKALKKGLVEIVEKNSGGSVPELRVINKGKKRVLLLDSEELAGAKQNRILNTSILLKKESETIIPVSCTEAGRWDYNSPKFKDSGNVAAYEIRRKKVNSVSNSLKMRKEFHSNQSEVWDNIDNYLHESKSLSRTRAMKDFYDQQKHKIDDYVKAFPIEKGQKGFIILINGRIAGMDFISSEKAFEELYEKMLKSYAAHANIKSEETKDDKKEADVENFIKRLKKAETSRFKSVGHGYDNRISSKHIAGNMLTYRGEIIHLAVFDNKDINKKPGHRRDINDIDFFL